MPTTTSPSSGASASKARAKAARKPASSKRAASAARTASPANKPASTGTARASAKATPAERAILIPVGAALVARDKVIENVSDTISTYASPSKTQAQLRRFERRGTTARNRLEREVRKARVRVERELRERRRAIESTVGDLDERREAFAKNGSDLAGRVPELANRVQERILSLV